MDNEELITHLKKFSIQEGDFVLKSGRKSNWFCDAKQTICRPEGMLLVAEAAIQAIPDDIQAIGGLAAGADPVAFGVASIAANRGKFFGLLVLEKNLKITALKDDLLAL